MYNLVNLTLNCVTVYCLLIAYLAAVTGSGGGGEMVGRPPHPIGSGSEFFNKPPFRV